MCRRSDLVIAIKDTKFLKKNKIYTVSQAYTDNTLRLEEFTNAVFYRTQFILASDWVDVLKPVIKNIEER